MLDKLQMSVVHLFIFLRNSALFIFEIDVCDPQRKRKVKEEQAGWETEGRQK